ncbi:hypothetical protein DSO57_1029520 [Entomophthora muscae]|uniref:Uncharacterized protein n=1 Tax=Entomophthora muscae TaxID=34485 RepID=A0ACC2TMX5_9FUNG|nr:hypothetical protein DSO57_1029520 [Entomophthora muscae]
MNATKDWNNLMGILIPWTAKKLPIAILAINLSPAVLHLTSINPRNRGPAAQPLLSTRSSLQPIPPPNPVYSEFTLEEILIYNPEAITRETETVYREGHKITIPPLLFCDKYNHLPVYLASMTPPLTLQPNHPQESVAANESTSTQIFGVMYITLTGLIDSMVPASRHWAILGKLLSYIVKLAPILWWALPARPAGCLPASFPESPTGWIPDNIIGNLYISFASLCVPNCSALPIPCCQGLLPHT